MKYVAISVLSLCVVAEILMNLNPFGLGQRIMFGQRPPYHWVDALDHSMPHGPSSVNLNYVGSNGKVCAAAYKYTLVMSDFTIYGFGFNKHAATLQEAKAIAERECR